MATEPPPDGYRWTGNGMEMVLVDPARCPECGRAWPFGQRTYTACARHRGHPAWQCGCGAKMIRLDGVFVTAWSCD
jgi:hypothetical protein